MISFLLLILGFLCSSFPSCFKCRVRLFIWDFSCFLRWDCIAINFPLRTAFTASHRFWVIVLSLSFVSIYLLISSSISSVISWLFSSALFILHVFVFFTVFFPVIDFQSHSVVVRKDAWYDFNFLNFPRLDFVPRCDLSWRTFHVQLRRKCILPLLGGMFYKYQLDLSGLLCHLKLMFPYLFSVWMICPLV